MKVFEKFIMDHFLVSAIIFSFVFGTGGMYILSNITGYFIGGGGMTIYQSAIAGTGVMVMSIIGYFGRTC